MFKKTPYFVYATILHSATIGGLWVASNLRWVDSTDLQINVTVNPSSPEILVRPRPREEEIRFDEVVPPKHEVRKVEDPLKEFLADVIAAEEPKAKERREPDLTKPPDEKFEKLPEPEAPSVESRGAQHREVAPVEVHTPPPKYPRVATRRGYEGSTRVEFTIDLDGVATNVHVVESSGYKVLDDAAVDAVKRWRFQPSTSGGIPVTATKRVKITFVLPD